jgi:hypothetical protein
MFIDKSKINFTSKLRKEEQDSKDKEYNKKEKTTKMDQIK